MKIIFSNSSAGLRVKSLLLLIGLILSPLAVMGTSSIYINSGIIAYDSATYGSTVSYLPNIDATNFYNSGIWNIYTLNPQTVYRNTGTPYTTANTMNYTNTGTMTGSVGWEFDFGSPTIAHSFFGGPKLSASFVNGNGATIQAVDGAIYNPPTSENTYLVSYLLICATNLVNKGTLIAGSHGEIVLQGGYATLSRGILETTPIAGQGSSVVGTNFIPDVQIYSLFWGTNFMSLNSPTLWNGTNTFMNGTNPVPLSFVVDGNYFDFPSSSSLYGTVYNENNACGSSNIAARIVPFTAYTFPNITPAVTNLGVVTPAVTNIGGSSSTNIVVTVTNIPGTNSHGQPFTITNLPIQMIRQAVFLNLETNSGIVGQVRFSPSPNPTNAAQTVAVRLSATSTNVITLSPQTSSVYLVDTLMSQPNLGLVVDPNIDPYYVCSGSVHSPTNYTVSRLDSGNDFANGSPGGGLASYNFFNTIVGPPGVVLVQTNVFYNTNLSSSSVPANYTAYAAYIDNLSSDQQLFSAVTNLGGRIIINANNLDLSKANLVAGGYIKIQASNLVSSAGAVVNCQYLSFNLGSTNGYLNLTNLASQSIAQLQGNVVAWSAVWTNFATEIITNFAYDSVNSNYDIPANITNTTEIDFYDLVVDASSLSDQVPVTVQDLILHSTNIVVSDSLTVANTLLLDGTSFTLQGQMDLSGAIEDWTSAVAPKLLYFTNYGYLNIPYDAHFGDDTAVPYVEFDNDATRSPYEGIIIAADQTISSRDIQINYGVNYTFTGDFSATAQSMEITGPPAVGFSDSIYSGNDINLAANTVLMDAAALYASGALNFDVANSLSDDNGTACSFTCYNGFNLWIKPQFGDLPGSTITSIASLDNEEIDHAWAGIDYGPSAAGYSNNVAIGTLALSAQNPHSTLEPLFHFYGTGGASSNAMYVYTLDLSGLTASSTAVANMIQIDPGMKIYFYQVLLGFTPPNNETPEAFLEAQFPGQFYVVPGGTNAPVSITVDAQANQTPISPLIYGVGSGLNPFDLQGETATSNQLSDLNFTVNRSGGNTETRYNYQLNCHNHAGDWYFESIQDEDQGTTIGATADAFVTTSKGGGAQPMITISMIGWVPKVSLPSRANLWSYSVIKYGAQTAIAPDWPDAGNGISAATDLPITNNNPTDANTLPTQPAFQQGYVQHLISKWGASTNGGVRYYFLDNESSFWYAKHQDVHPVGATMSEIWGDMLTYAIMIKTNDPNALVLGPEEWGWNGYLYSGYDQQWFNQGKNYNPSLYPDRNSVGGWDYIPWLLHMFNQDATNHSGRRLLDYVTVHCYPQGDNGNLFTGGTGGDLSTSAKQLRNRSTRQFWDTNYTDQSWINAKIALIPRLKTWVATNYPGTKIGLTEYSWGAEADINGATAQADILGILGREGVDLATRWQTPPTNTPTYLAMKMYRNYDGNKSTFGDTSIHVVVPNPDDLSIFGAVRSSDGALTFMVINKDLRNASPITLNITNANVLGTAQRWQLTSSNVINQLAPITLANGALSDVVPVQSITLYVLPAVSPFKLQTGTKNSAGQLTLWLNGQAGLTYILQSSTDLFHWGPVSTNTLSSNSYPYLIATTNKGKMFYRGLFNLP
jgi:hypothetical protein